MIRRRIVLAYWVIALAFFVPGAAYAYIDPATTTYLIQIITALVVTVGVSLSVFLYRFKMITSKIKFRLYGLIYRSKAADANEASEARKTAPYIPPEFAIPGKTNSPEITIFCDDITDVLENSRSIALSKRKGFKEPGTPLTYAGRMRLTVPLALAFCFAFIVIGCLELTIQFAPELPFRPAVAVPYVLLCFALVFAVLIFVIPRFRGKVFEFLLTIGFGLLLAGYIQGNYLNWGLGQLTGDAVIWGDFKPQIAASVICWIGALVLAFLIWRRSRTVWRGLIIFVPFLVILLQGVAFISVINESTTVTRGGPGYFWQTADETLTIEGINSVANEKNAILIVLDRLDQEFIEEIAAEDPDFFSELDGFTEFDDFIQYFGSTFPSVAAYLTGHRFMYDMPRTAYFDYAWANAEFMHKLRERGIDIRLYVDRGACFDSTRQLDGLASNTFKGQLDINKRAMLVKLLKLSGYRFAPIFMKQAFWLSPYEFYDLMILTDETAPYMVNNFGYYESLITNGLSVWDDVDESFKYLHLQGSHPPLNMNEYIEYVEEATIVQQSKGALRIVYEYLRQLRELGHYEDSVIIIMGDHGNYLGNDLERPARAGLLVKPAGSFGTPLEYSHAPVSPDQLHATFMEGLFGSSEDFGPTFFDISEGDPMVREYTINRWRYRITGDGRDFSNWEFIGMFPEELR